MVDDEIPAVTGGNPWPAFTEEPELHILLYMQPTTISETAL